MICGEKDKRKEYNICVGSIVLYQESEDQLSLKILLLIQQMKLLGNLNTLMPNPKTVSILINNTSF